MTRQRHNVYYTPARLWVEAIRTIRSMPHRRGLPFQEALRRARDEDTGWLGDTELMSIAFLLGWD